MRLRLKYEPSPANAPLFAADIAAAAQEISGVSVDYTPQSLALVDDILEDMRDDGPPAEAVAETLFGFGCYVGEVMTRHGGGVWVAPPAGMEDMFGFPLGISLPDGYASPISKVFKRYENGPEDSLVYFYRVFCESP